MRAFFVNNEIYMAFLLNSQAQGVSGKINKLPKHHGAGPNAAACKMSVVSFALAVIFIIRLFITSVFRVPKLVIFAP